MVERKYWPFLCYEQRADYAPRSGEIIRILKEMGDEMGRNLASATSGGRILKEVR